jgi:hypothetical protein
MADNLDFQDLTKYEPFLFHIVNVFWTSIELSNKFSNLQHQLLVKNVEVYETDLLYGRSLQDGRVICIRPLGIQALTKLASNARMSVEKADDPVFAQLPATLRG